MWKKLKKSLTICMALVMLLSTICSVKLSAFAEDVQTTEQTESETEMLTTEATDFLEETWSGQTKDTIPLETDEPETLQKPEITEQTIVADVYESGAVITLNGNMPEGSVAEAYPVQVSIEGQNVLAAYDITIYDAEGNIYQPAAGAIRVEITDSAVTEALDEQEDISVYHMEDAEALPQQIEEVNTDNQVVVFDAESFSIYVVTTPETHFTCTYNFYSGGNLINTQILSAGEVLNEPETPNGGQNQIFDGWYTVPEGGEKFVNFGKTQEEMTESSTVNLYAHYREAFYVFYKAGPDVNSKILYTQIYSNGAKIVTDDVPFVTGDVNKALTGWSTTPGADLPNENLIINGSDVTLYPVVKEAHWIIFNSQGGSILEPKYVLAGSNTEKPSDPIRVGYSFGGWYTEAECITPFDFGSKLNSNITLYAKWNPSQVNYTVIYWQQKPDDDGYSLAGHETQNGTTGTMTNISSSDNKYDGFHLSTTKPIEQRMIAGDGSSVVYVYYDRNIYEVQFVNYEEEFYEQVGENQGDYIERWSIFGIRYEYVGPGKGNYIKKGGEQVIPELTISARYGQDISALWPSRRTDLSIEYPSNWKLEPDGDVYQAGISTMPLGGTKFYYYETSGKYTLRTEYYLENLSGDKTYFLDHADEFKSNDTGWTTTENDYYDIKGFSVDWTRSDSVKSEAQRLDRNIYGWRFYYNRNSYKIQFFNADALLTEETYLYQADISRAGFTPEPPVGKEDYLFDGWYNNELLEGERYDFNGKTMPAGNFPLYAKWVAPSFTVRFDLNGGNESDIYADQMVKKEGTVVKPENPVREGYEFAGWTRNGEPFNFDTQITEDITLVAQWISNGQYTITYNANNGTDATMKDSASYVDGAEAKILDVPQDWTAPNDNEGFICWNTEADGSGTDYYPGDVYVMPAGDVTLYAQWAEVRKTTLTYDFNGGKDEENNTSVVKNIAVPNGEYGITDVVAEHGVSREGYEFIGWTLDQAGEGTLLQTGDLIRVDTIGAPGSNVLYAQWERLLTVTVHKEVEGNMGDVNQDFRFDYTVTKPDGTEVNNTFTLKDGADYLIKDLPEGCSVTVTETSQVAEGYTTTVTVGKTTTPTNIYEGNELKDDVTVTFTNTKFVTTPTGIFRNIFPFVMMTIIALGSILCFFVLYMKKRIR